MTGTWMAESGGTLTLARFAQVAAALSMEPGVSRGKPASRTFGLWALQADNKTFAKISPTGHFLVRLPKQRVEALATAGRGQRSAPRRGGPTNEWLDVHSETSEEWLELAREALGFVRSLP